MSILPPWPPASTSGTTVEETVTGTAYTIPAGTAQAILTLEEANTILTVRPPTGMGDTLDLTVQQPPTGACPYALGPPGSPSISIVGSPINTNTATANSYAIAVDPTHIGDIMVVTSHTGSAPVSAVSGGGVAKWRRAASSQAASPAVAFQSTWWGVVTTTGASTLEVTYAALNGSGGQNNSGSGGILVMEFTAGAGNTAWSFDKSATNATTNTTTISFPALTPTLPTGELYVGQAFGLTGYTAGSTAGFTYASGGDVVYGTDVTTATGPTATAATAQWMATAALFFAGTLALNWTSGAAPAPSLQPGAAEVYQLVSPDGINWNVTAANISSNIAGTAGVGLTAPIQVVDPTTTNNEQVAVIWSQFSNAQDSTIALETLYSGHANSRHIETRWGNYQAGQGFVLEFSQDEPCLIVGAVDLVNDQPNFPVSTYMDGSSVVHLGYALATDGDGPVGRSAPTSGAMSWVMPFVGATFKVLMMQFVNYVNDTATNDVFSLGTGGYGLGFQAAFVATNPPVEVANDTGLTVAMVGDQVTITAPDNTTPYNGFVVFVGY